MKMQIIERVEKNLLGIIRSKLELFKHKKKL